MRKEATMFGKEDEMRSEEGKLSTIIAKGTKINGNIDLEGSIRIDGYVKGKVKTKEILTVGNTGVVEGEVHVREAVVGGKVQGSLIASQKVTLENRASILGDVTTGVFVIKEGGVFHGKCSMKEGEELGKEPPAKAEPKAEPKAKPKAELEPAGIKFPSNKPMEPESGPKKA
jgi:cytoskeletal protein CcmA (bactofilin family)